MTKCSPLYMYPKLWMTNKMLTYIYIYIYIIHESHYSYGLMMTHWFDSIMECSINLGEIWEHLVSVKLNITFPWVRWGVLFSPSKCDVFISSQFDEHQCLISINSSTHFFILHHGTPFLTLWGELKSSLHVEIYLFLDC
jgi:hypothetical protein